MLDHYVNIADAAKLALVTCPKTSWEAKVYYDHTGQRLAFETMKRQLLDEADRARAKTFVMLIQWALTGKWPMFRNAPVYFLNEILQYAAERPSPTQPQDFPVSPPPWDSKHAAIFFDRTALSWFYTRADRWASEIAGDEFDFQKSQIDAENPLE